MKRWIGVALGALLLFPGTATLADRVFYLNASGDTHFMAAHRLSNGSLLLSGQAANLDWVPSGITIQALPGAGVDSASGDGIGFILQVSADLSTPMALVHFPQGTARSVYRMRSTEIPGQSTGALHISGHRENGSTHGYYIARLNNNFVDGLPDDLVWVKNVDTRSDSNDGANSHKGLQPWDVGSDGKVIYAHGEAYRFGWAAIYRLDEQGRRDVVEDWRIHWLQAGGEWRGSPASAAPSAVAHSGIVMKNRRIGQLRSATDAEYYLLDADENGNPGRQGRWPDDYYFAGPCVLSQSNCDTTQPGYTGYRVGANDTQRVGSIVVDRRSNAFYFGYSSQSTLPGGNPDFEPAVVAMTSSGDLKWWARLYRETTDNSPPDQYVDGLAIDYGRDELVVLARSHGNNVVNFWSGNEITLNPGGHGFQNRFTGTNGNIHLSWLGRYGLDDGGIYAATWVGEFNEGATGGTAHPDPNLGGWPNPNAGWPDLNTTRCRNDIGILPDGAVLIGCSGRRSATTVNAHQRMPLPGQGVGSWNFFVRIYTPDLSGVVYSSLLTGDWDQNTGQGGDNTQLTGLLALPDGLLAVGHHKGSAGQPEGEPMPVTANIPSWGRSTPTGQTAFVASLKADSGHIFSDRFSVR